MKLFAMTIGIAAVLLFLSNVDVNTAVLALSLGLAAFNGANDTSKGVATLAAAGVTSYRKAIVWGALATLAGSFLSVIVASKMTTLFSTGILTTQPTTTYALAVLAGSACWVAFATAMKLPVSTTHAIIGALIGAAILYAPQHIAWAALAQKVALPLFASILISYLMSALLGMLYVKLSVGANDHTNIAARLMAKAHWLTSGAASFARGLNDTPKILAVAAFGLAPTSGAVTWLVVAIALSMAIAGILAGLRVAKQLGENVVAMNHAEGFQANLTTAILVAAGANLGLPMSTTHVATGAIAGVVASNTARLNKRTLRDFIIAWTLTPLFAGAVAAAVYASLT